MKQSTLLGGIVIILVLGGIIWYAAGHPWVGTGSEEASSTPAMALPAASPYVDHGQYYDIAANYPTSTPLAERSNGQAMTTMRLWVADQVAEFKKNGNFDHLTAEDVQMMGYDQGRKQTLQIGYLIASSPIETPRTYSYIFTEYLDTLGAHGNDFFKTFTFDAKTGAILSLGDLFQSGTDYLGTLSPLASASLTQSLGDNSTPDMIANGTAADAKNFQNWFLDNRDLVILYAPYDVAPYAAGPQTVRIPLANLASILKPDYLPK